ncbi:hypothetical protein BB560_002914 [Smittium megazygosporum]|uniref:Uncharacterized protein n=1 Tax=Smittium megazygosporum TaxID=133381 RepID=A0A2T9ZDJ9_9FUNG|nr:hypothetical protein BB560_002914 [Smittium megazygosporum]
METEDNCKGISNPPSKTTSAKKPTKPNNIKIQKGNRRFNKGRDKVVTEEEFKETEPVHPGATIQNGNIENGIPEDKKEGLYGKYRPDRRISVYTNTKNVKEAPSFPSRKKNASIQGTPVWTVN